MKKPCLPAGLAAVFLLGVAGPIEADLRLDRHRAMRVSKIDGEIIYEREFGDVVFLGDRAVRHDMESETFIVRADEGVFMWLDHDAETYSQNPLPLRLEDLLTEAEKRCLESFPKLLDMDAQATVKRTEEQRLIGRWNTRRLGIEGRLGEEMRFSGERWVTHDLEADLEPYHLLVGNRSALSPRTRAWIGQLLAEGGVAVETTTTWTTPHRHRRFELELQDVREVEPEASRYQLPAGYTRVPRPRLDVACVGAESAPPSAKTRIDGY